MQAEQIKAGELVYNYRNGKVYRVASVADRSPDHVTVNRYTRGKVEKKSHSLPVSEFRSAYDNEIRKA